MPKIQFYDESFGASAPRHKIGRAFDVAIAKLSAADLIRLRVELEYETPKPQPVFNAENLRQYAAQPDTGRRLALEL